MSWLNNDKLTDQWDWLFFRHFLWRFMVMALCAGPHRLVHCTMGTVCKWVIRTEITCCRILDYSNNKYTVCLQAADLSIPGVEIKTGGKGKAMKSLDLKKILIASNQTAAKVTTLKTTLQPKRFLYVQKIEVRNETCKRKKELNYTHVYNVNLRPAFFGT